MRIADFTWSKGCAAPSFRSSSLMTCQPKSVFTGWETSPTFRAWGEISIHPRSNGTLYVGFVNYSARGRAWRITNADTPTPTWTNISGNLPAQMSVYQIQADPNDPDNTLYAATDFGLYYTLDGGVTWSKETRVPNVPIFECKLRPADRNLFLFTHGRGAWRLQLDPAVGTQTAKTTDLDLQIFPNPTANQLFASYELPIAVHHAQLEVYDLQGKKLLAQTADGTTQSIVNVQNLPTGTYILRMTANGVEKSRKFVVVR